MRTTPHRRFAATLAALAWLGAAASAAAQEPAPAAAAKPDLQTELEALKKEFSAAQQTFFRRYGEMKTDEERAALWSDATQNPNAIYAPRFRAFAERAGLDPAAGGAWMFLLGVAKEQEELQAIVARLMKDFLHAPAAEELAQWLQWGSWQVGREAAREHLRALDGSRHAGARAAACFSLGCVLMNGGEEADPAAARAAFERLKKDFADSKYASQADGYLFELDNLQVGMVAPEIEGADQDGAAFKLSEYRGKVVVLDFWGFW